MSFVCNQIKSENDLVFVLEVNYNIENGRLGMSITKNQTDIQTGDPDYEQYFLDFILKEAERDQLVVPDMSNEHKSDPLTFILNKNCTKIADMSRRGFGNTCIINLSLRDRVGDIMKTVSFLFNKELIINDSIPENVIIIIYKGAGELDGPFFIGSNDMAFAHPNWKNYVRVLELT